MRVVVTGGAGFIGSNLAFTMIAQGHELLVIDDLSSGDAGNIHPATDFRTLSILDPALTEGLAGFEPDAVVHLAAQTDVNASIADPEHDRRLNVEGTRAVARAAAEAGAKRVLSASSAAIYGEPIEVPLTELSQKHPANPYGSSKLEAESILAEELLTAGVDFASLRFSNVYGPRQDWQGEGGAVAIFSSHAVRGEPATIYGSGEQTRDFVYVGDVVGAIQAALAATTPLAQPGHDGPAYNISTGREVRVVDIADEIIRAARYTGGFEHGPARPGDVDRSALDPNKAREVFGWTAVTPLDRGIALTVDWFREQV